MNAPDRSMPVRQSAPVPALAMDETQLITVLENSLYPGASSTNIALVINYCRASGLDPMQKPVHIVPMWDSKSQRMRDVVMPGVGLYRTQAARTGEYAGVTEPEFGPDVTEAIGGVEITYPAWCRVAVKRLLPNGDVAEFSATERWKENYAVKGGKEKSIAPNAMWTKRPYGQIAKCAEAQALRKAFPEMIGSQPTADEMEGKQLDDYAGGNTIDASTGEIMPKREEKTLPPYPAESFARVLAKWRESGTKSPEEFAAMLSTKGKLSDDQLAEIYKGRGVVPAVTFEQVKKKIEAAEDTEILALAADLIDDVADPAQREQLTVLYKQRMADFNE